MGKVGAALFDHILGVVFRCPEEEMVWPDAGRVVAAMENQGPGGHFPAVNLPRQPVREAGSTPNDLQASVPLSVSGPGPFPATVRLFHLPPEPHIQGRLPFRQRAKALAARFLKVMRSAEASEAVLASVAVGKPARDPVARSRSVPGMHCAESVRMDWTRAVFG